MIGSYYITALFIYALVLCTLRSQWQALLVLLVAPYVVDTQGLLSVFIFTSFSHLYGRLRAAADS